MNNSVAFFRSMVIYGLCLPLAVYLGFLLTDPLAITTLGAVGLLLLFLSAPLLLRIHYPLLLLSWNASMVLFFLPGRPSLWMAAAAFSLFISIGHRTLHREFRFIRVPQLTWPLLVLLIVILVTAKATGGMGMRSVGGGFGGKKYVLLLGAIMAYFALTAQRIPPRRAGLYLALFFLGGLTNSIGDFFPMVIGSWARYIYLVFPPTSLYAHELEFGITRFIGFAGASTALFLFMMSRYGIRGIFLSRKPLRLLAFGLVCFLGLFGGFRSLVISLGLTFVVQFFLEGMHRTKLLPVMILLLALGATLTVPFVTELPPTFQRALAFLPLPIDPAVRADAQGSSDWRLGIWKRKLTEVPKYLWVGKGYLINASELMMATDRMAQGGDNTEWAEVAGDYHSGPLSVIIPFGIWGAAVFLWFLVAGGFVLVRNYRYGDPDLRLINAFLIAAYISRTLMFFIVAGAFESDILNFVGFLGLSVSLNGGVARRAPQPVPATQPVGGFANVLPRPRSAFGR